MPSEPEVLQPESSAARIAPGEIIAERYLVGETLGGGGMGVVCAGTHILLGTPVAIKLINSELKDDPEAIQRFVMEARATAALKGEHIARVFDVGVLPSGEPYLVMEQLEGVGLDQYLLERGKLAPSEAVEIVLQVCEGLAEAHTASLVHRDIKPGNLFLARRPDGQFSVKILDFGIAKQRMRPDTPALTNPGKSLGSPWYMSPEQMLTPASVDERADVWSIGVLLFELLTDARPFDGDTVPQVCASVLAISPPPLGQFRTDVAPELEEVVLRCLEKERERRFRSVTELAQALQPFAPLVLQAAAIALDPAASSASAGTHGAANDARSSPSYGTLRPLQAELDDPSRYLPPKRRAWPLAVALVAIASLMAGGWLQYRDPTLVRRAIAASRVTLPGDPKLSETAPASDIPRPRPPEDNAMLQGVNDAHAAPEMERPPESTPSDTPLTPAQVQKRIEAYDAWLRAQGLQRAEDRYGF